jgi:XRE family transcriptional regulator of biofilm formation
MSPRRIGKVLREAREKKGLTQLALAKKAKVAQGYISELEAGVEKNPGVEVLKKLARALGVPLADLLR